MEARFVVVPVLLLFSLLVTTLFAGMEGICGGGFVAADVVVVVVVAFPKSPKSSSSSETVAKMEVGKDRLGVEAMVLARSATLEVPRLQKPKPPPPPVLLPPGVRATAGGLVDVGVVYRVLLLLGVLGMEVAVVTEGLVVVLLGVLSPSAGIGALVASPIPEKASPMLAEVIEVTGDALYWGTDIFLNGVKGASCTSTRLPKASPTECKVELLAVEIFREGVEGAGTAGASVLLLCCCCCCGCRGYDCGC